MFENIAKLFHGKAHKVVSRLAAPTEKSAGTATVPELGLALLRPGSKVGKGSVIPLPAKLEFVDPDSDRIDLPPRSPEEIQRLIDAGETPEGRDRRILNDKTRYRRQVGLE